MSRTLRVAIPATLLTAFTFALAGCGGDDAPSADASPAKAASGDVDLSKVTLRVGVQKDGIRAVLERTGQLKDIPYKVEFSTFQFGPPLVEAAGADKIDLAWVGSTPPLFGAAANANFKVIAAVQEADKQENSLLVPKDSTVKELADLKGKKIAVPKGSSANGFLFSAFKRLGLNKDDFKIEYLAPADGLAAFSAGSVDAWVVWDPFVQQATQSLGAKVVIAGEPDEHGIGLQVASAEALKDPAKRAAFKDYLSRLSKAWDWARANPDGWAEAWSKDSKLPIAVTKEAAKAKASTLVPVSDEIVGYEQTLADLLFEDQVLPNKVDFKSIVDDGIYTPES